MTRYDIDYKKLALNITPIKLRNQLYMAFQYLVVSPISRLAKMFDTYRTDTNYRLHHNGQVCYLRAVLNDLFDSTLRRIQIEDLAPQRELVIWKRNQNKPIMISERSSGNAIIVSKRGFGGADGYDFVVICPLALRGVIDETRMRAVLDQYKLASKRYTITYA
ncbi:MAG: hypothetical protein J6J55_04900 [Paludibacteraceae bacterium]|nr:hypothetical protein [Paludibacteraceae bacterium]